MGENDLGFILVSCPKVVACRIFQTILGVIDEITDVVGIDLDESDVFGQGRQQLCNQQRLEEVGGRRYVRLELTGREIFFQSGIRIGV